MRTVLYNSLYLDGVDKVGTPRLQRNVDWITYYADLDNKFDIFDKIVLADNGSSAAAVDKLFEEIHHFSRLQILPYEPLEHWRPNMPYDYRHLWRVVYKFKDLLQDYDKILFIDTDTYILNRKCLEFIKGVKSGWHVFWSNKYQFPAAEVQVICKDMLPVIEKFTSKPIESHYGQCMETTLPYTEIHKEFVGDRYGEGFLMQHRYMDWYSQTPWQIRMIWDMEGKLSSTLR